MTADYFLTVGIVLWAAAVVTGWLGSRGARQRHRHRHRSHAATRIQLFINPVE